MKLRPPSLRALVLAAAVLWIATWVAFCVLSNDGALLVSLLASLAFVAAVIGGLVLLVRDWRTRKWVASLPLAACLAAVPAGFKAGDAATRVQFAVNLPDYEKLVARADVQALQPGSHIELLALSATEREGIDWAGAQRTSSGKLVVEIQTAKGFLHHAGYVYTSGAKLEREEETQWRWPYRERLRAHWFAVSN